MFRTNWVERTKKNIIGIIDIKKADYSWKKRNQNDSALMKDLNKELQQFHVKLRLEQYQTSPFLPNSVNAMPIILKYVDMCERKINRVHLLSTLRAPQFFEAVPYLLNLYKDLLKDYDTPQDELLLLSICETIEKIGSDKYTDQYIDLLKMPITPSAECIIRLLSKKILTPKIEMCILSLVEKENIIPKAWIGKPNETDKYWCSQIALIHIAKTNQSKYYSYLERFLYPQNLPWIYFTDSKYCQSNYSECYKRYVKIAKLDSTTQ